jgi:hypothetical protein
MTSVLDDVGFIWLSSIVSEEDDLVFSSSLEVYDKLEVVDGKVSFMGVLVLLGDKLIVAVEFVIRIICESGDETEFVELADESGTEV